MLFFGSTFSQKVVLMFSQYISRSLRDLVKTTFWEKVEPKINLLKKVEPKITCNLIIKLCVIYHNFAPVCFCCTFS